MPYHMLTEIYEAQIALLRGIIKGIADNKTIEVMLEELLPPYLQTSKISEPVLYLFNTDGSLKTHVQIHPGNKIKELNIALSPIFTYAMQHEIEIQLPSKKFTADINKQFLDHLQLKSALLLPIFTQAQCSSLLLLGSQKQKKPGKQTIASAQALSFHLGEAITLAQAFKSEHEIENKQLLKKMTRIDTLTDLNNRSTLLKLVSTHISRAKNNKTEFALAFISLDRLGAINNFFGYDAGDHILQYIANFIKKYTEDEQKVARISSHVFAMIITKASLLSDLEASLLKLLQISQKPVRFQDKEIYLNIGIGTSHYPADGKTTEQLLAHAELALNHCKRKGSNNYIQYKATMTDPRVEEIELEAELHKALELRQLELFYQPLISTDTQDIVGAEALLRWTNPRIGMLMPNQFIPLAETTGLIVPIGEWVLQSACQQISQLHDLGYVDLHVAVNLSTRQFNDPNLLKTVTQVLKSTQIRPTTLILEITESILMNDISSNSVLLKSLSDLGVMLASDDFGIGYSSLNYLRQLPFDILKIDKSFIQDMELIYQKEAIVSSIIALGKDLNLKIIAEGIEKQEQFAILKKYRCDFIQGHYFSRAISFNKLMHLLLATERTGTSRVSSLRRPGLI